MSSAEAAALPPLLAAQQVEGHDGVAVAAPHVSKVRRSFLSNRKTSNKQGVSVKIGTRETAAGSAQHVAYTRSCSQPIGQYNAVRM
jgi:hypothetical protein